MIWLQIFAAVAVVRVHDHFPAEPVEWRLIWLMR